jgi:hypothetical protein
VGAPWPVSSGTDRLLLVVLSDALITQLAFVFLFPPGYDLRLHDAQAGMPFAVGVIVALILLSSIIFRPRKRSIDLRFGLLLVLHFSLGVWLIHTSPQPHIDVHIFQQQGAAALLRGLDPYSIRNYPDIYGPNSGLYGPGLVQDGHLTFGFSYPPLSLFLAIPGYLLGGDFRYSQLVAMELGAFFIAAARPSRIATLAALLFLFTPRTFFVLEQGWTDPFAVMLLAASVFAAIRVPRLLPVGIGLFIAVKQHLVLGLPLAMFFLTTSWRDAWRLAWRTILVAGIVSLPLILWNVPDFVRSAIVLHLQQPYRADSLSFLAWLGKDGQPGLPTWLGFALLIPAGALAAARLPRTPAGFSLAVALVYFVFFAFNKQAFVQYYYFLIGALCCALATWEIRTAGERPAAVAHADINPQPI